MRFQKMPVVRSEPESGVPRKQRPKVKHMYYIDTCFLQRVQKELTPREPEEAMLVSGVRFSHMHDVVVSVPTTGFLPRYRLHSVTGVEAEPESVNAILAAMEANGQSILARFHSHPGPGIGMCRPSGIDIQDQRHWEGLGYETISAIFTRSLNGSFFVNIFTEEMAATIQVLGTARQRSGHVWEIPEEPIL
jgi:proteasome lid subunit RPN8/RPN11